MSSDPKDPRPIPAPRELSADETFRFCNPSQFEFATTADLPLLHQAIGQERAVGAVDFGVGIRSKGYNIYALGPTGTGKASIIMQSLQEQAAELPVPDDWVYVNNFTLAHKPNAIRFPPGSACAFRADVEKLIQDLQSAITLAFEGEEYDRHRREIAQEVSQKQEEKLDAMRAKAEAAGYLMLRTPAGLAFAPKTEEGEPMPRETYNSLPEEDQHRIDEALASFNAELQQIMRQVRQDEKAGREQLRELDNEVTNYAAKHLIDDVKEHWAEVAEVGAHLDAILADVVEHADDFKKSEEETPQTFMGMAVGRQRGDSAFRRYEVNVVVDNGRLEGAPVVRESNPTLPDLLGRVEHLAQFGALFTDFSMIMPGALHAANGGFLVLEARELLTKPYSWDALKRAIKTAEIRIEDLAKQMGLTTTVTLDPEPIPLNCKVVMLGEPMIYYLLYQLDPDFQELFKVKADFDTVADRTAESEQLYARLIANVGHAEELPPFTPDAVARVVEHGSRLVEDQRKLSARFRDITDLVREAAYWAYHRNGARDDGVVVDRDDVDRALEEHSYRSSRIEERIREMITDGTIMVDTAGAVVGQINGLSVSSVGDYAFGRPSRITATTRLGEGKVVDIEREVEMSGPIHSKGVLILAGYLGSKYASDRPLSLNARLVFEQSYSGIEGDSASSAELYAILSSLSGLPVQQRFAVTGSVNQRGLVQPIGGVNEKVEGFYEVCMARGLQGDEGVLIPQTNIPNLMLKEEVRKAIEAGSFHIHPVGTIDEGIAILTGVEAGEPDEDGVYPKGSVNRLVMDRLTELGETAREQFPRSLDGSPDRRPNQHKETPPAPPVPPVPPKETPGG